MDAIKDLLLSSPDDALICPLCRDVYSDPMMTECGHTLCFRCHRDDSPARQGLIPNCALAMLIDNLPAKCPQHHQGCSWTGTLNEVRRHSLLCEKAPSRKIIGGERMDPMLDGNEHLDEIVRNIQLDGNDGRVICFAGNKCAREGGK